MKKTTKPRNIGGPQKRAAQLESGNWWDYRGAKRQIIWALQTMEIVGFYSRWKEMPLEGFNQERNMIWFVLNCEQAFWERGLQESRSGILRSSKWDPCFGWITSVFCCSQVSTVAQAGIHQTHAGCMIRENFLLEFLGGTRTSHSEIHPIVFLNETQRVLLSFSLEEVSAQWDIVILHTQIGLTYPKRGTLLF